jgi:hypothetical protein
LLIVIKLQTFALGVKVNDALCRLLFGKPHLPVTVGYFELLCGQSNWLFLDDQLCYTFDSPFLFVSLEGAIQHLHGVFVEKMVIILGGDKYFIFGLEQVETFGEFMKICCIAITFYSLLLLG